MAEDSDPFECRLVFLSLLNKLNASQQSIYKVASYAMRHRKLSEDLYSCLIEELEQASLNARLNIVYVLDAIFSASVKSRFTGYVDLTKSDLERIIQAVVPNDPKGVVNLPNMRKILHHWKQKRIFDTSDIEKAEKPLLGRETNSHTASSDGFSKQDILRRMEEDRERHKRLREEIWIRSTEEPPEAEFEQLWENTDGLDLETDYEAMMVENMTRLPHYAWHMMLTQRTHPSLSSSPPSNSLPPPSQDIDMCRVSP
ncbi:CTD kinase subunit gamma CTK3-domain-containing protein [Spinellus fusiger]|nr:CTD kinase subunit gamma CTK3-domain-containing protein [Spinellus fusiger]